MSENKATADPELILALAHPGPYANRFYLSVVDGLVRLSFGEQGPDGALRYHSAITVGHASALALAELIQKHLPPLPPAESAPVDPKGGPAGGVH